MATSLPYLAAPGSITTALTKIRSAATPERVTTDFVTTKLMMKGGTGAAIPPFLKKINFVASDGTPTELYKTFRNPNTGGRAVADAIKFGYQPLLEANEYFYELPDSDLLALILQITGLDSQNKVAKHILSTLNNLKSFASFDEGPEEIKQGYESNEPEKPQENSGKDDRRKSDSSYVKVNTTIFTAFLKKQWITEPDAITIERASVLLGYNKSTISKWIKTKKLKAVAYQRSYLIPKEWLIKYLVQTVNENCGAKSQKHMSLISQCKEK